MRAIALAILVAAFERSSVTAVNPAERPLPATLGLFCLCACVVCIVAGI